MNKIRTDFLASIEGWVCDGYSLNVAYLALLSSDGIMRLLGLSVSTGPQSIDPAFGFAVQSARIAAGQIIRNCASKDEILAFLRQASSGHVTVGKEVFSFDAVESGFETEQADYMRWEYDLHLRVSGVPTNVIDFDLPSIDRELRLLDPPFDGVVDLAQWLGLSGKHSILATARAELRVKPPVDIVLDSSSLKNDILTLRLVAHPELDIRAISIAIRSVPGVGITARRQIGEYITWSHGTDSLLHGEAVVNLKNSDNVLVIVSAGVNTVRRQWLIDPVKARNTRAFAAKHFDQDFRQLRRALLDEGKDSSKFEQAVASLLYLNGFAAAVQQESDAPDILVSTPAGRLLLVECTFRVADFASKLGKLVDRRISLIRELNNNNHTARVYAVLLCRVMPDQLVYDSDELQRRGVILLTQKDIEQSLQNLAYPPDPDDFLSKLDFTHAPADQ